MLLKRASCVGVAVSLALVAGVSRATAPETATASAPLATGTLSLQATQRVLSPLVPCAPQAPPDAVDECRSRTGSGSMSGLGDVSAKYFWSYGPGSPPCPSPLFRPNATTGRLVVAGKGDLHFTLAQGAQCVGDFPQNEPQDFTITGGTGTYQGASGSGKVGERLLGGGVGRETWTGTLDVPGLEFDVTRPTLSGATSKTLRAPSGAKRVRVTYKVTASDNADAQVPVTCAPRSGSRFPIGRTIVKCSATDSSGNTASASFRITVRVTK